MSQAPTEIPEISPGNRAMDGARDDSVRHALWTSSEQRPMSQDLVVHLDTDRFRICQAPADERLRRHPAEIEIETPHGPRRKSVELLGEHVAVALYLLERGIWSGPRAKHVRTTLGLSMHELAYLLGEADQAGVVARERGDSGFTQEQARKLRTTLLALLPADVRDRLRSMSIRSTQGDDERLFYWV